MAGLSRGGPGVAVKVGPVAVHELIPSAHVHGVKVPKLPHNGIRNGCQLRGGSQQAVVPCDDLLSGERKEGRHVIRDSTQAREGFKIICTKRNRVSSKQAEAFLARALQGGPTRLRPLVPTSHSS